MAETLVKLERVTKAYKRDAEEVQVLQGLDFSVDKGDYVALMGPSGSGKTTLLNLLGGIDQATSGRVEVAGVDLGRLSEKELARWRSQTVGFIFQLYHLIPVLTAAENVELPLLLFKMSRADR